MGEVNALLERVFNEIVARDGYLDVEKIHDEVANPSHPLHGRYEWDNAIAGRLHRLEQIRSDIRVCRIKFITDDGEQREVRRFTAVRKAKDSVVSSGYRLTDEVISDPLSAKILLRQFQRELASLHRRYGDLEQYVELMQRAAQGDVA